MNLELKHIIPYLPYNLKVNFTINSKTYKNTTLTGVRHNSFNDLIPEFDYFGYFPDRYFPLLIPLSKFENEDLDKVHEFIGIGKWCEAYDQYFDIWFDNTPNIHKLVLQAPYEIFQYFLSEHYDVFGLIDNGLAIEI